MCLHVSVSEITDSRTYQLPLEETQCFADGRHVKPIEDTLWLLPGLLQAGRGHKARRTAWGHVQEHITDTSADKQVGEGEGEGLQLPYKVVNAHSLHAHIYCSPGPSVSTLTGGRSVWSDRPQTAASCITHATGEQSSSSGYARRHGNPPRFPASSLSC